MPSFDLLTSAPERGVDYRSTVLPLALYKPAQVLFGFDAQLTCFGALAKRHGGRALFTPFPQLFTEHLTGEIMGRARGADGPLPNHFRFGPVHRHRVVRGLTNVAVLGEQPSPPAANLGLHPFGEGAIAPASMQAALAYTASPAPLQRYGSGPLTPQVLPDAFVVHDLAEALRRGLEVEAPDPLDPVVTPGLQVDTAADVEPKTWATSAGGTASLSPKFWRLERERRIAARGGGSGPGFVLIPLNLTHPGSAVASLVAKLASFLDRRPALHPVLFPYNLSVEGPGVLERRLEQIKTQASAKEPMQDVFVARLTSLEGLARVAETFPTAWLDGSDPEHAFVRRRLEALGIRPLVFGAVGVGEEGYPAEERRMATHDDDFGRRIFSVPEASLRSVGQAIAATRAVRRPTGARAIESDPSDTARFFESLSAGGDATSVTRGAA